MLQRAHPKIKYNKEPSNYASHIMNTVHKDRNIHSTLEITETNNKGACINKSGKYYVNCTKISESNINKNYTVSLNKIFGAPIKCDQPRQSLTQTHHLAH
jgi:hypothetical protein